MPAEGKTEVEEALVELKAALAKTEEGSTEAIKSATEKVATSSQKLGAAMYADAAQSPRFGRGSPEFRISYAFATWMSPPSLGQICRFAGRCGSSSSRAFIRRRIGHRWAPSLPGAWRSFGVGASK